MKYYRLKYRLSIQHSADNNIENKHSHVVEVEVYVRPDDDEFIEFQEMDKMLKMALDKYQHKYLNELEDFQGNVTMEGIAEVIYSHLLKIFDGVGWMIARLQVSETPLRTYAIVAEEV